VYPQGIRILIVEDDSDVRDALAASLSRSGYDVDAFACGEDALDTVNTRAYVLAIVDVRLPGINGIALVRAWRHSGHDFPTLVITALPDAQVVALEAGATDYLSKPFSIAEIEGRIRVLLRHCEGTQELAAIHIGKLVVTPGDPRISIRGEPVLVNSEELALVELLTAHAGHVVRTAYLASQLARGPDSLTEAAVAVHVDRLRARLAGADVQIRTLRGFGYLLEAAECDPD
jgi:DNA-binding response OmpR family regulator